MKDLSATSGGFYFGLGYQEKEPLKKEQMKTLMQILD